MGETLRHRDSDPVTSADAVADTDLELGQAELLNIYEIAAEQGVTALAQHEAVAFGRELGSTYSDSRLRSAHKELERRGLLRRVPAETRPGPTRKRRAEVWALVKPLADAA